MGSRREYEDFVLDEVRAGKVGSGSGSKCMQTLLYVVFQASGYVTNSFCFVACALVMVNHKGGGLR